VSAKCGGQAKPRPVDEVLERLREKTVQLRSYQANIDYLFKQPLFESQTLRKGILYYAKFGDQSMLRVNFKTLKQDDEKQQDFMEQYVFDGIWLTQIDYQLKTVKRYQLVDPNEVADSNEPLDAFELVSRNFPIVGFSNVEDLKKEFEVTIIEDERAESSQGIQLHLDVKSESIYRDDYVSMDFWVDSKIGLPAKIVAVSTEEDIHEISLLRPQVNKELGKEVFELAVPEGFTVEEKPLKKDKAAD
jgi:outer membrane lipoprotein-sorting protein